MDVSPAKVHEEGPEGEPPPVAGAGRGPPAGREAAGLSRWIEVISRV